MAPETFRRGGDGGWSAGRMLLLVLLTHDEEEEAGAADRWLLVHVHGRWSAGWFGVGWFI